MKTVIISGISKGIGRALAQKFLDNNYFVIGTTLDGQMDITHENLAVFKLDLSDATSVAQCASQITKLDKKIDILINSAGVLFDNDGDPDIRMDLLRTTLNINLIGHIDLTQHLLPVINDGGHIVNISSRQGSLSFVKDFNLPAYGFPSYKISKAALNMFTRVLASRLHGKITVSSVHPGAVKTGMARPDATMEPEEAAEDIYNLAISNPETGQFWYKGEKYPW